MSINLPFFSPKLSKNPEWQRFQNHLAEGFKHFGEISKCAPFDGVLAWILL
jgi:hypothetical protein